MFSQFADKIEISRDSVLRRKLHYLTFIRGEKCFQYTEVVYRVMWNFGGKQEQERAQGKTSRVGDIKGEIK